MKNEAAFAIIRIDAYPERDEDRFTITRIVWDEETAEAEAERLNKLNAEKGCRYFWQTTRAALR